MSTEAELKAKYETLNNKAVEAYNKQKQILSRVSIEEEGLPKLELKCRILEAILRDRKQSCILCKKQDFNNLRYIYTQNDYIIIPESISPDSFFLEFRREHPHISICNVKDVEYYFYIQA